MRIRIDYISVAAKTKICGEEKWGNGWQTVMGKLLRTALRKDIRCTSERRRLHGILSEGENNTSKLSYILLMRAPRVKIFNFSKVLSLSYSSMRQAERRVTVCCAACYPLHNREAHQRFVREGERELAKEMSFRDVQERARNAHTLGAATLSNKIERMHRRDREQKVVTKLRHSAKHSQSRTVRGPQTPSCQRGAGG